jgi:hypothetical protein
MEDLNIDEVKQLLNFYKQKSADLEFQFLQLQIKMNKLISSKVSVESPIKSIKTKSSS